MIKLLFKKLITFFTIIIYLLLTVNSNADTNLNIKYNNIKRSLLLSGTSKDIGFSWNQGNLFTSVPKGLSINYLSNGLTINVNSLLDSSFSPRLDFNSTLSNNLNINLNSVYLNKKFFNTIKSSYINTDMSMNMQILSIDGEFEEVNLNIKMKY